MPDSVQYNLYYDPERASTENLFCQISARFFIALKCGFAILLADSRFLLKSLLFVSVLLTQHLMILTQLAY